MSVFTPEKQAQAKAASLLLAQRVREYFKDEQHRQEFEVWYQKHYGKAYEWKGIST
nr:MAG TPA: hypothetical protein [Caudoviricetes sp.]